MPWYKVKPGGNTFRNLPPGSLVELLEEEAASLKDKLELVPGMEAPAAADDQEPESPFRNDLGIDVPDEMTFLPKKPKAKGKPRKKTPPSQEE